MEYRVTVDECQRLGRMPTAVLRPHSNGFDCIRFAPGDYTPWPFTVTEPADFRGDGLPLLGAMTLFGVNYATIDGLEFVGGVIFHAANHCTLTNCRLSSGAANAVRLRFGSSHNDICYNAFARPRVLVAPGVDVIAVQLKTGLTINNRIRHNVFSGGWSDCVQTTYHVDANYPAADCGGTIIEHNVAELTGADYAADGQAAEPIEQFADFKLGGAFAPIVMRRNRIMGFRPNGRGAGYSVTIKDAVENIESRENVYANCTAGIFIQATNSNPRRIVSVDDRFVSIHDFGEPSAWPTKSGRVLCGTGPIDVTRAHFIDCDAVHESTVWQAPRQLLDCRYIRTPQP